MIRFIVLVLCLTAFTGFFSVSYGNDSYANFDLDSYRLDIPCLGIMGSEYRVTLVFDEGFFYVVSAETLTSYTHGCALFEPVVESSLQSKIYIPVVKVGEDLFWIVLQITSYAPLKLTLSEAGSYNKMSLEDLSMTDDKCLGYIEIFKTGELDNNQYSQTFNEAVLLPENSYCQAALAYSYMYARGVDRDIAVAFELAHASAGQGNSEGQAILGDLYQWGWNMARDTGHAYIWSYLSADQANPQGMAQFGYLHATHGLQSWMETNGEEALFWIKEAADQENLLGYHGLGFLYSNGVGVAEDKTTGHEWRMKCSLRGDLFCQKDVGADYLFGYGVQVDKELAYQWLERSAAQNHPAGMSMLALYYQLEGSMEQSLLWNEKCHDHGDKSGNCAYGAGNIHFANNDFDSALEWYKKAGDFGDLQGYGAMATMYKNGTGVPQDYQQMLQWLERSEDFMNLGLLYEYGMYGQSQDVDKACTYYTLYYEKNWQVEGTDLMMNMVCH